VGDGDAGGVEVIGDLGEGIAFVAEGSNFWFEEFNGLADGDRGGDRGGQGSEALAGLFNGVRGEGRVFFGGHRNLFRHSFDGVLLYPTAQKPRWLSYS